MDIEVADVNLCALHCELRNTEQLLSSLGLTAHRCGSLKECNKVLAEYGPETMTKDRIILKLKEGQDTHVDKHNIKVRSFSGDKKLTLWIITLPSTSSEKLFQNDMLVSLFYKPNLIF